MTADFIPKEVFTRLLDVLMPQNALVLELCVVTGMRITDALKLTSEDAQRLINTQSQLCSYRYIETKTGKERVARMSADWCQRALAQHDPRSPWLFAGRDPQKHRSRQAVWKDLKRAAKLYRISGKRIKASVSPHTARKIYAVELYQEAVKQGLESPLEAVKGDLNHNDAAVTYLYALADEITARKRRAVICK